jgi:hypothetical protein
MANNPPRHPPKTSKQAKQEYKLRSGPQLSAQQLRHIERRVELEERAQKCRDKEKRRKELAKRKKEKDEGERAHNKTANISLSTQLAGFSHTQIGLKRKMEAWIVSGNGGASKRQKINDEKTASEPEDEFDGSDKENEPVPGAPPSNQPSGQLSVPRQISTTSPNMPPVDPAERSNFINNHKPSCNSQVSPSGPPSSFHTALDELQDNSNTVDEEEEFDFIDDDELLNALGLNRTTVPSSKTLSLEEVGFAPHGPSKSEKDRTNHCPQSGGSNPTFQQAPAPAIIFVDAQDIPDDFWVTDTQLERDLEETSQEIVQEAEMEPKLPDLQPEQRFSSSDEFGSSLPWDLVDEAPIIADLLGESLETTKAKNDSTKEHATLAGASKMDPYTIGLSTQILVAAAAKEDFCLDDESFTPAKH